MSLYLKHAVQQIRNNEQYFFFMAVVFFITNSISQYALSSTANLDQAEQLVFSQDWHFGYSSQPPLFTWLVRSLFFVTGPSLLALIVIKVFLLSALVGLLILMGKQLGFTPQQQLVSLIGMAFIPQYVWESQRDITHSLLATVMAAATLLQLIRIRSNPSILNYVIAGLLAGAGTLSKYNYLIFILALIIAAAYSLQYRQTILNYRSLVSMGIAILTIAPHGVWAFNNMAIATSSVHKFSAMQGHYLHGITEVVFSLLKFLTPLWIIGMILHKCRLQVLNSHYENERSFMFGLFAITIAIISLLVVLSGAQNIRSRWYQPLLFYIPLWLALSITLSQKQLKAYCTAGVLILVTIAIAFPARILLGENVGNKARLNLPYQAQARDLANSVEGPAIILSESNLIGGNMKLFFKTARIITPEYDRQFSRRNSSYLILCETKNCKNRLFRHWLLQNHGIDVGSLKFEQLQNSYSYIPKRKHVLYWAKMDGIEFQ